MSNETPNQETTFGYLSVINSAEHGYFGGYLIVGPMGRPLEFHCTAPIRPSRAQQILYGPTLEPFLLGEQIAGAMLDAAKLRPSFENLKPRPVTPYYSQMSADALQPNYGAAMSRSKTPDQAIKDMADKMRQDLKG